MADIVSSPVSDDVEPASSSGIVVDASEPPKPTSPPVGLVVVPPPPLGMVAPPDPVLPPESKALVPPPPFGAVEAPEASCDWEMPVRPAHADAPKSKETNSQRTIEFPPVYGPPPPALQHAFSITLTVLAPQLGVAMSGLPSPLKSATATPQTS